MLDLFHVSRDDLIRLVLAQRDEIADLTRRQAALEADLATQRATIARLTAQLGEALVPGDDAPGDDGPATPRTMPGLKPAAPAPPPRSRKRRAHGFARRRMAPTARQVHALPRCPECGTPLAGGTVKRTREVIEVPPASAVVTEHVYLERRCPRCGRRCVPPPEVDVVVVGQSRVGIGLTSLIAVLREEGRLPFATIQHLLQMVHGVDLSGGALVGAVQRVAARAAPRLTEIRAAIRASPVVGADETGWRENGRNGYAWTFQTPTARLFVRGTREKAVLERELGPAYPGVLVSDFYGAYTHDEGRHQYCWAHLLRDIHELAIAHPRDVGVRGWAAAVHALFGRAKTLTSADPGQRCRAAQACQAELAALCAPYLPVPPPATSDDPPPATAPAAAHATVAGPPPPDAPIPPQRTLCQRIERHLADLFVFVEDPAVPPTNNGSERSLRPLVVSRKISGGTRADEGSDTKMALASVFGTWRAQGLNPFAECRRLLATPQP